MFEVSRIPVEVEARGMLQLLLEMILILDAKKPAGARLAPGSGFVSLVLLFQTLRPNANRAVKLAAFVGTKPSVKSAMPI
jgi:hypothetical protein